MDLCGHISTVHCVYICKYEQCIPIELLSKNCCPGADGGVSDFGPWGPWFHSGPGQSPLHGHSPLHFRNTGTVGHSKIYFEINSSSMFIIIAYMTLAIQCW